MVARKMPKEKRGASITETEVREGGKMGVHGIGCLRMLENEGGCSSTFIMRTHARSHESIMAQPCDTNDTCMAENGRKRVLWGEKGAGRRGRMRGDK